jgi:hypothetical protein
VSAVSSSYAYMTDSTEDSNGNTAARLPRQPRVLPDGLHQLGAYYDRPGMRGATPAGGLRSVLVGVRRSWRPMMPHIARTRNQKQDAPATGYSHPGLRLRRDRA